MEQLNFFDDAERPALKARRKPQAQTARQRRDEGITRAAEHSGEAWQLDALEAIRCYATTHELFLTEDARFDAQDLPAPPDGRAWGQVMKSAQKRGFIRRDGFGLAKSSNLSPKPRWRSLIFQG